MEPSDDEQKWLRHGIRDKLVSALSITEDVVYITLAVLFALTSIVIIVEFIWTIQLDSYDVFVENSLDHFLIVFMLIELMHTILLFLKTHRFRHEPFLMVGMIAGIRTMLIMSAHSTAMGTTVQMSYIWELGVTAGVILVLAIALRISRTSGSTSGDD
ncbi:MAG: phosphate-starvation-inducible PsiE family protein [Bacilli bacterium]